MKHTIKPIKEIIRENERCRHLEKRLSTQFGKGIALSHYRDKNGMLWLDIDFLDMVIKYPFTSGVNDDYFTLELALLDFVYVMRCKEVHKSGKKTE